MVAVMIVAACDLQPRIVSLPDSVGDFISTRYPALLADPETQPEIYNSAATDYGVYASPELYGSVSASDDYLLYASVDDYVLGPQDVANENAAADATQSDKGGATSPDATDVIDDVPASNPDNQFLPTNEYLMVPMYGKTPDEGAFEIVVARGDTLYSLARKHRMTVDELAGLNNLSAPYNLRVGQKLAIRSAASLVPEKSVAAVPTTPDTISVPKRRATTTVVELQDVIVGPGDTLYSLSRKFATPVNDLAVMNKLSAPFALRVGQKLRVPRLDGVPVRAVVTSTPDVKPGGATTSKKPHTAPAPKKTDDKKSADKKSTAKPSSTPKTGTTLAAPAAVARPKKISSDPAKKLPAIAGRSSSKFTWPVRGKILSQFGAKSGGLFNDGINIGASRGATVAAAENGVVAYAGNEVKGMGNLVIIQHSDGWMTVYAHMDSMTVRRGTRVKVGQKIGTVGATGKVSKPQLHFEIRKGTRAYNPSTYLKN